MSEKRKKDFCIVCRKETEYELKKIIRRETIRNKSYDFSFTVAVCKDCGEEMSVPGLLDLNIQEQDDQYRKAENIITIEEIKKLMDIYDIGKAPLSLALGFGEVTITRYLEGQMPSKKYSAVMRNALESPSYMEMMLEQNGDRIRETAYRKAMQAVLDLKKMFKVSDKMLSSISYIFEQMREITPLALQKLLYFAQGVYMTMFGTPLYSEDCQAWVHGPVYCDVYRLFKDFKYDPIDDIRFSIFSGKSKALTADERRALDLVIGTFGVYSGKVLEKITHNEKPWIDARNGYAEDEPSNIIIEKEAIHAHFVQVAKEYSVDTQQGLNCYIAEKLQLNQR